MSTKPSVNHKFMYFILYLSQVLKIFRPIYLVMISFTSEYECTLCVYECEVYFVKGILNIGKNIWRFYTFYNKLKQNKTLGIKRNEIKIPIFLSPKHFQFISNV